MIEKKVNVQLKCWLNVTRVFYVKKARYLYCVIRTSDLSMMADVENRRLLSLLFGARCSGKVSNSQTFYMFLKLESLRMPIYSGQCSEVMVHSLFGRWLFLRP